MTPDISLGVVVLIFFKKNRKSNTHIKLEITYRHQQGLVKHTALTYNHKSKDWSKPTHDGVKLRDSKKI